MTIVPDNLDHVPECWPGTRSEAHAATRSCPGCGHVGLRPERISCAVWHGGGLAVIRGIPALVCPACEAEHIAPATARALARMRRGRFRAQPPVATVEVPVFQFAGAPKDAATAAEPQP